MGYKLGTMQEDCYPDTNVLINKLGITDAEALEKKQKSLLIFCMNQVFATGRFFLLQWLMIAIRLISHILLLQVIYII